jgi:GNAT superfamily N-acetyltransferase
LILRDPSPGDFGWIVHRHGVLYSREYGWDFRFEALVAEIAAKFVRNFDPAKERCWIAEEDGRILGSIFAVRDTGETAKLRLFYVEPDARGSGIGTRLVQECVDFARSAGYKKMVLWTDSLLLAARRIYARAGFKLIETQIHSDYGENLTAERWEIEF